MLWGALGTLRECFDNILGTISLCFDDTFRKLVLLAPLEHYRSVLSVLMISLKHYDGGNIGTLRGCFDGTFRICV